MKIILVDTSCIAEAKPYKFEIENSQPTDNYIWKVEVDGAVLYDDFSWVDEYDTPWGDTRTCPSPNYLRFGPSYPTLIDTENVINKTVVVTATKEGTAETTTASYIYPFDFPLKWATTVEEGVKIGGDTYAKNDVIRVVLTVGSKPGKKEPNPFLTAYDQGGYGTSDAPAIWKITPSSPSATVKVLSETTTYIECIIDTTGYLDFAYYYAPQGDTCHGVYDMHNNVYVAPGKSDEPPIIIQGTITGPTSGVCNYIPIKYETNSSGTVADNTKRYDWSCPTDPGATFSQDDTAFKSTTVTFTRPGSQYLQCEISSTDPECINTVFNNILVNVDDCGPPNLLLQADVAVQRGAELFSCKGSELFKKTINGDLFFLQRGRDTYTGTSDQIIDTDLLACTYTDGVTYKVTGEQFKTLI